MYHFKNPHSQSRKLIGTTCLVIGLTLSACGNSSAPDKTTRTEPSVTTSVAKKDSVNPQDNRMVVLPPNARLAQGVVYPPKLPDGQFGDMETQATSAFAALRNLLKQQNLTLGNVSRIRVTLVADEKGFTDYEGFQNAYDKYFGTQLLPSEPVAVVLEAKSLHKDGPLLVIEADIAISDSPKPNTENK